VSRRAALRATCVAGFTLLAALAGWRRLTTSPTVLVPADDAWVRLDREITQQFGMALPVVWVVEARGGSVWTPAALARVQAITQDALQIPGVIPTDVMSLASPNMRDLHTAGDTLEPVYLMPEVPATADGVAALRRRVESDPMLHGSLVSRDGRAAMIVANFQDTADPAAVARAALAVRDRHRGGQVDVWVVGAPVLRALASTVAPRLAVPFASLLAAAAVTLALALGWRRALRAAAAALLAAAWTALLAAAASVLVLPWSAFALVPVAALAGAGVMAAAARVWRSALALACGLAGLGLVAGPPASAFAWTGMLGAPLAVLASRLLAGGRRRLRPDVAWRRPVGAALALVAAAGALWLRPAFALAGYGERWLPPSATGDLRALTRHFPPPSQLAVRLRGAPGFVAEPAVLRALDGAAAAARADPATTGATSVADLVALVHHAFGGAEATTRLPDDRGLVARYLALAYSPGFHRFVDRGMSRTALWVQLRDDDPRALDRVRAAVTDRLASATLPPGTTVDLVGGDGAVVLVTARGARRFAGGLGTLVALAGILVGAALPRAVAAGTVAAAVAAGLAGWLGLGIDLVTLPAIAAVTVTAVGLAALSSSDDAASLSRSAVALAAVGGAALLLPYGLVRLAGILLISPALATAVLSPGAPHSGRDEHGG
jgi:hypothetical protein